MAVNKFIYLGSTLSRNAVTNDEVNRRLAKASASFGRLRKKVRERRGNSTKTKIKVYRAIVQTTLLYGCETWTVYSRHARKLNRFYLTCLCKIMKIKWQQKIPDTEVLSAAKLPSINTLLQKHQISWAGHVCRMPDERIPRRLMYGELSSGKRSYCGERKRLKDTLKISVRSFNIDIESWELAAQDRSTWRGHISQGATKAEEYRKVAAEEKRRRRKERLSLTTTDAAHFCPVLWEIIPRRYWACEPTAEAEELIVGGASGHHRSRWTHTSPSRARCPTKMERRLCSAERFSKSKD